MSTIWISSDYEGVPDVISALPPSPREGWSRGELGAVHRTAPDQHTAMPAWINGKFAVHPMLKDPGFTISLAKFGWRLSVDGRVFRSAEDACAVVESFDHSLDWEALAQGGSFTPEMRRQLCDSHTSLPEATFHKLRVFPY